MGMFGGIGDIFQGPGMGEVLKAVANPVGSAGAAVGGLLKQSGILDDIGKLLDGGMKKPKGLGLGGIADQIKKAVEGIQPGLPKGFLPPPSGLGGLSEKIRKMIEQMPQGGKTMPPGYGGGKAGGGYGGVSGGVSGGGQAGGGYGGQAGGYGGGKAGGAYGGQGAGGYGGQAGGYGGGKAGGGYGGGGAGYAAGGAIGGLATAAQKAIFIATLQKIIQDVASKPGFDMNRAINDVWMQVSALRAQQAMKEMTEAFNMIEGMMKAQHEMSKSVIQNLR